jgi:hypothetical protein
MLRNDGQTFWAHSDRLGRPPEESGSKWQQLSQHLLNVATIAERLARLAAPENVHMHRLAFLSGMLHDYGKYTDCFQQMIFSGKGRCPHAIYGALAAFNGNGSAPRWTAPATRRAPRGRVD